MWDDEVDLVVERRLDLPVAYDALMPNRIRNILLVSSLYDSFTFVEDGHLTSMLATEYMELNIRFAPRIHRVSTAKRALEFIENERFDLVISMMRLTDMNLQEFGARVRDIDPALPVVLLAFNPRELRDVYAQELVNIDRIFVWNGDATLFLAIIKYVEDKLNAMHDARSIGVHSVLLIEDSVRFYSSYLPMLYTEIFLQTQLLLADGLNEMQRMTRQHARPKVLLASNWEKGLALYEKYKDYFIGVITDAAFPRDGIRNTEAGIEFARMVKDVRPDLAVLVQSSEQANEQKAHALGAAFINKRSPRLMHELRTFMKKELGFGDFFFRDQEGKKVTRASDLRSFTEKLRTIPEASFNHHVRRKDFSTWLIARSEFELARSIRASKAREFDSPSEYRSYLVKRLESHRAQNMAGVISEFSSETFEAGSGFVRIGSGSLGGKGRGLAFFHTLLNSYRIDGKIPGIKINVPPAAVLATGVFEEFIESSGLTSMVLSEAGEEEIFKAILEARLPNEAVDQLRTFLGRVHYPLAVRSSSLLEDASNQPFAGIYETIMLPNNSPDLQTRLRELVGAIKTVYASTYSNDARAYLASTPNRLEEERMAVVIQQVFGQRHEAFIYPDLAGVARSYNYYPFYNQRPDDGVVCAVLGLGRTVVEGGRCMRFTPVNPTASLDIFTPRDFLNCCQREFWAIDLKKPGPKWASPSDSTNNFAKLNLEKAKQHGTFQNLGSIYTPAERSMTDDLSQNGIPLITMSKFLQENAYRLNEVLGLLLDVCQRALSCPVEIEWAANIHKDKQRLDLAFLQVRPMGISAADEEISIDDVKPNETFCNSDRALGNGIIEGIRDIIYVPRASFDRTQTADIADAIGDINEELAEQNRQYILIGPGRWGSADARLGTPVAWGQISAAACIVETDLPDFRVNPSQGSHFFQNITSFGIGYFTINDDNPLSKLNIDWLLAQEPIFQSEQIKHLSFDEPIDIVIDGRIGSGVIMKPGKKAPRKAKSTAGLLSTF